MSDSTTNMKSDVENEFLNIEKNQEWSSFFNVSRYYLSLNISFYWNFLSRSFKRLFFLCRSPHTHFIF